MKIVITQESIEAAISFLMDFYSCAWGSEREGICKVEAEIVVMGILKAAMEGADKDASARL